MADIVFMGTPEFAVPTLEKLLQQGHNVKLVVCQPDKKQGRGQKVTFSPVKTLALEHHLELFQPHSLRSADVVPILQSVKADFFVVIAYGKILPEAILALPGKACINVHASLLPKWRGAAPIHFSILNGERETGVSTMLMDEGMDTGDILLTRKMKIDVSDSTESLGLSLSKLGADLLLETIADFDTITPTKQDSDKATYTRLLNADDRLVKWDLEGEQIFNQFRALSPVPGIFSYFRGKRLKINRLEKVTGTDRVNAESFSTGKICKIEKESFLVSCKDAWIEIFQCQPESKKAMSAKDFVNGYQVKEGEQLGLS